MPSPLKMSRIFMVEYAFVCSCIGLGRNAVHICCNNLSIRGYRMIFNKVNCSTTYDSLNSSEEPQAWSHCRDEYFRTWSCKVCDNCSSQKEL